MRGPSSSSFAARNGRGGGPSSGAAPTGNNSTVRDNKRSNTSEYHRDTTATSSSSSEEEEESDASSSRISKRKYSDNTLGYRFSNANSTRVDSASDQSTTATTTLSSDIRDWVNIITQCTVQDVKAAQPPFSLFPSHSLEDSNIKTTTPHPESTPLAKPHGTARQKRALYWPVPPIRIPYHPAPLFVYDDEVETPPPPLVWCVPLALDFIHPSPPFRIHISSILTPSHSNILPLYKIISQNGDLVPYMSTLESELHLSLQQHLHHENESNPLPIPHRYTLVRNVLTTLEDVIDMLDHTAVYTREWHDMDKARRLDAESVLEAAALHGTVPHQVIDECREILSHLYPELSFDMNLCADPDQVAAEP